MADGPVDEPITIELDQVPLPEAIHRILRNRDYAFQHTTREAGEDSPGSNRRTILWVFSEDRANDEHAGHNTTNGELKSSSIKEIARNQMQFVRDIARLEQYEALLQLNLVLTDEEPG